MKEHEHKWKPPPEVVQRMVRMRDAGAAGILAGDLANNKVMSLVHAERQIKAWVDKNHKGNVGVCTPKKAEEILRAFYGLGEAASAGGNAAGNRGLQSTAKDELDLEDFL